MSYVDALFDREHDRIHVVERREGIRQYQEYRPTIFFIMMTHAVNFKVSMELQYLDSPHAATKSSVKNYAYKTANGSMNLISIRCFVA